MADIEEEGLKRVEAAIIADGEAVWRFRWMPADGCFLAGAGEEGRRERSTDVPHHAGMCQNGTVLTETRESPEPHHGRGLLGRVQRHALLRTRHHRSGRRYHVNTCSYQGTHFGPGSHRPWPRPQSWA